MTRLSQIKGQRVLTVDDAQQVGGVRRLILDAELGSVAAAHIEGTVGETTMLPWEKVKSIGPDALMVESVRQLEEPDRGLRDRIEAGHYDLEGKIVYTDQGDSLGTLEDIEFDERSGRVLRLHVPGHALPLQRFVAVGPDAVIVTGPGSAPLPAP